MSVFGPPIAARLNKAAPGANLNATHVFHLLAMCPFESVAKETMSPFCAMFTEDDFRAFEYYGDLEKYYKTGCVDRPPADMLNSADSSTADTGTPLGPFRVSAT